MSFSDYLEMMLTRRGFWSDANSCWKEINENDERFEDVIAEVGQEYNPEENEKFDFEVECDHVYDSPGVDIFVVAIAYAYIVNGEAKPVAQSIMYTTYIS